MFRVTHNDDKIQVPFTRITTSSGQTLDVSPMHFIHGGPDCCDINAPVMAKDVKVGDSIYTTGWQGGWVGVDCEFWFSRS